MFAGLAGFGRFIDFIVDVLQDGAGLWEWAVFRKFHRSIGFVTRLAVNGLGLGLIDDLLV